MAAEANIMARKSRPLPKNTVEKNWSSMSPRRERTTPTNHRKAIPAKGTNVSASEIVVVLPCNHVATSVPRNCSGRASRMSIMLVVNNTEKMIPATAAARGVLIA